MKLEADRRTWRMKVYLLSLAAGLLVGVVYSLLNVRSPAPPLAALIGLLGILAGEQILPFGKQLLAGKPIETPWRAAGAQPHVSGPPPGRDASKAAGAAPFHP